MSHFALQLMRQFRNVQPDLMHSPADAQPGHLVLLSAHRKPVNPLEKYQVSFFLYSSNINKSGTISSKTFVLCYMFMKYVLTSLVACQL